MAKSVACNLAYGVLRKVAMGWETLTEKFLWLLISNNPFGLGMMNACKKSSCFCFWTRVSSLSIMTPFYFYLAHSWFCSWIQLFFNNKAPHFFCLKSTTWIQSCFLSQYRSIITLISTLLIYFSLPSLLEHPLEVSSTLYTFQDD